MLGRVFKAYDIRGTYPDLLTDQMAWQIGYGSSRFLLKDAEEAGETTPMMHNVVVGRDIRKSSPKLTEKLIGGINAHGGDVIEVGVCDTPLIAFAVNHFDCAGGVMVTASHNPPQYNGFKICKRKAKPVGEVSGLADIRKYAAMADKGVQPVETSRRESRDLWDAYAKHVLRFLDLHGKPMKIVVDASNGSAGAAVPKIFGKRGTNIEGLQIVELNFEYESGEFAHEPNPLVAANLVQLQEAVRAEGADLGICFDGDADRCMIVDERGEIVGCDLLTAALSTEFLEQRPGAAVAYDLRSSMAVREEIEKAGGKPYKGRVGHVFMKQLMAEHDAVFGGELSGHFYFRGNYYADSGVIAMASVLSMVARRGVAVSEIIRPIARYVQSGEINFEIEEKDAAINALVDEYADRCEVDDLDGVSLDCFEDEGWWCNVRKSNTEPLLRLNAEARDAATLESIVNELAPMLGTRVAH